MRLLIPPILFILIATNLSGQITITSDDMPKPGDTLRQSITLVLDSIDYESTGENYTWDYSELTVMLQQVDTFVSVSSTPALYQAVFNNQFLFPDYKATVAKKLMEFDLIPNLEVTDTYQFFKETGEDYREVGLGITLAGIPLPIMYQDIDTLYRFPLEYGVLDSTRASISIDIPNLGYLGVDRKRRNSVDGWGTLITPYGEFPTLRVKTEIYEYDSVYIDSLNIGFPVIREYVEYKWLANGFSLPLLTVTGEGLVVSASYIDSVRTIFVGMDEDPDELDFDFKAYPNPASEYLSINYELFDPSRVIISFYSLYGKEVTRIMTTAQDRGLYNKLININEAGLRPGIYLLYLQIDGRARVKRIMIQ
jgi:hypothetical protein